MSHLGPALAASAVVLLTIPSAALADVPTTASKSFVKTEICQPGDTCINTVQQNADGTLSGRLAVTSQEDGGNFQSEQGFAARFTDTFFVFSRTGEVTFEQSWRIEGSVTEVSLSSPAESTRLVGCTILYGEPGRTINIRPVQVPTTQTFSTSLTVPGKGRHKVTVYTELDCSAADIGRSQAELELTEASLDHMHVTGTPR